MKVLHSVSDKTLKKVRRTESDSEIFSLYDIAINGLDDTKIDLSQFQGKYLFFVNVASKCGFTDQYRALERLSNDYGEKLVVIGVPCNQFGSQEPGTPAQIKTFCEMNYGVTFLMTEKIAVKGKNQHPLYQWLTQQKYNGKSNSKVRWNFQKYLVSPNGELIDYFYSTTTPLSSKITNKIV